VALRSKKALLMTLIMSPSMLDLGCFVNFKIFFVQIVHLWYHHFQDCTHDYCVWKLPPHATLCKVPISLTIEPLQMFKWSILKTFMTCLQTMHCATRGQLHYGHSKVGACIIHTFPKWLVDATNAMSSLSKCNRTFVFGISRVRKRALATMFFYLFFSHTQKSCIAPRTNSE
jgi:hypothetical protein